MAGEVAMQCRDITVYFFIGLALTGCANANSSSEPKWMLCANDQRLSQMDGKNEMVDNPKAGALTIMDVSTFPPKSTEYLENVSCSMVGPPTCVAITSDQKYALVTAAQKIDPENTSAQMPDNKLTVIRLQPGAHRVIQVLTLGVQPSGVDISQDGRRALVANRGEGSISLLSVEPGGEVRLIDTFKVIDADSSLSHVVFSPNGLQVLATLHKENSVLLLALNNDQLSVTAKIKTDKGPYCIEFLPDGKHAAVAHTGAGSVMLLEVQEEQLKIVDTAPVGLIPEGLDISPDGNWMVVNCLDNSYWAPTQLGRRDTGMLVLLKKQKGVFVTVDVARVGKNPQAVSFTPDSKFVAVGSNGDHEITFFKLEKDELQPTGVKIPCPGGPATLRISK